MSRSQISYDLMLNQFKIDFLAVEGGRCIIYCNGERIGDALSDNSRQEDHYRFHDVFHFTFMTFLDWSPCVRHLLKLKRKHDPIIDEVEDGARARSIEEGISAIIFEEALENDYFKNQAVSLDTIRLIRKAVRRLEVGVRSEEEWKNAIQKGYEAFNFLRENNGGRVCFDRIRQKLSYKKLERG